MFSHTNIHWNHERIGAIVPAGHCEEFAGDARSQRIQGDSHMREEVVAVVVRYQGGGNAGHTVITPRGRFVLHLLPSGVLGEDTLNVLGPGVALDARLLARELAGLAERGVPAPRLAISNRAQLLLDHHKRLDTLEEERLGAASFGSTRSGIAPFYADKGAKTGITVDDLFDEERLGERLDRTLAAKNVLFQHLYGQPALDRAAVLEELKEARRVLEPFVADTTQLLADARA